MYYSQCHSMAHIGFGKGYTMVVVTILWPDLCQTLAIHTVSEKMHCCWWGFGRFFAVLFSISLCGFTYPCVVFPKPFGFPCVFFNPCHFLICIHIIFNGKVHVFGGNTHRRGTKEQIDKAIYGFPCEVLNSPPMGFWKIVKSTIHWNPFCFCLSCPLKPL